MKPIDICFQDSSDPEGLRKAYILGYRTGYQDGINNRPDISRTRYIAEEIRDIPIKVLKLSTAAYNCLRRARCRYVSDVAMLSAYEIRMIRGMGKTTANDIIQALKNFGITDTEWEYAWQTECI